jgi:Spy/CpxP family protein refolding chaperone
MKKRSVILAFALTILVALSAPRILAQAQTSSMDPETQAKVQAKLQKMSSELNLTDTQKQQLKPIMQTEAQQLKVVKDDTSLTPEQRQAKAKEIHQNYKSQISNILTPDQQKKLEAMRKGETTDEK